MIKKKIEVVLFEGFSLKETIVKQVVDAEDMIVWARKKEVIPKQEVECVKEVKKIKPFMTRLIFQWLP